jgi:hypothetical protein
VSQLAHSKVRHSAGKRGSSPTEPAPVEPEVWQVSRDLSIPRDCDLQRVRKTAKAWVQNGESSLGLRKCLSQWVLFSQALQSIIGATLTLLSKLFILFKSTWLCPTTFLYILLDLQPRRIQRPRSTRALMNRERVISLNESTSQSLLQGWHPMWSRAA